MSDLQRYFQDRWDAENCTERLYLTHDLDETSMVFDVGGYTGDWTYQIWQKYRPKIDVFEPVKEYYEFMQKRFQKMSLPIPVFPYGYASHSGYWTVYKNGASSSSFSATGMAEICEFRDINRDMWPLLGAKQMSDVKIDLIAINIEGGEYDLLPSMIQSGLAYQCREIMVQFHPIFADSYDKMNAIRKGLLQTHEEIWHYPFVWSKYKRR